MLKMICFDMDGTIVDLYNVPNWLNKLRSYDASPYVTASPLYDMKELADILKRIQKHGIKVHIITWRSKETTVKYDKEVTKAKRNWLINQNFPFDHFHSLKYGATKADSVRSRLKNNEEAILFDDNEKVCAGWHLGEAFNPVTNNIINILKKIEKSLDN